MAGVVLGSEVLARGDLTRGQLRWNYTRIHHNVYLAKNTPRGLMENIHAAWLWSGRKGIIAGRAAAALHGAKWIDSHTPIEIGGPFHHPPAGLIVRRERIDAGDLVERGGLTLTNPARTAFDLARHLPRGMAVAHLDALSAATGLTPAEVTPLCDRYTGARGVRTCRPIVDLMDGGAQSPKETWLRLVFIDAGLPRPTTQIRVIDGHLVAYVDMGWEEPMVAAEYDGEQHRTDRSQYVKDIHRAELLDRQGWRVIRVIKEDRPNAIVARTRDALDRRPPPRLR